MSRSKSTLPWLFVALSAVVVLALIGWRVWQKRAEASAEAKTAAARKNAPANVQVAPVTRRTITTTVTVAGSIEAPATVQVSPRVSGILREVLVREGDAVRVGQTLARIDARDVEAAVRQSKGALAEARSRLAQARATQGAAGVGITSEIARTQAAVQTAQAQSVQAQANFAATIADAEAAVTNARERVAAANAATLSADAAIGSARANVKNAQVIVTRQESLLAKGFVSSQVVDTARAELAVRQATLISAQAAKTGAIATRNAAQATVSSATKQLVIARNTAKANVAVARATLAQQAAGLTASRANVAQNAAVRENIAALEASVDVARANVDAARVAASQTTLQSPLDGIVTTRLLEPGSVASATTPIVAVASVRRVWATVGVAPETAQRLAVGQRAQVSPESGTPVTGRIAQVLPSADTLSRQFTVRVLLDNPGYRYRPGTFTRVTFVTNRAVDALTVPPEAIRTGEEKPDEKTVLVVGADNTAQEVSVQTGLSDAKSVAVTGDLTPGDKVIVLSQRAVKPGQTVRTGGGNSKKKGGDAAKETAK